jgi:CTP:molybdopterin cytidylyltransferase MocA
MSGGLVVALLAAGNARRFGGGKLDADCAGKPLGAWALEAAQAIDPAALGVVVASDQPPRFAQGVEIVRNPYAAHGLGTSASAAARWAIDREADALLVMLADMPLVSRATLRGLTEGELPAAVAYPGGKPGVPACFAAAMLPRLAGLGGEEGAALLLRGRSDVRLVPVPPGELRDVDRPEDLAEVAALLVTR